MRNRTIQILIVILVTAIFGEAAVFNVNSFTDAVDNSIGNGICATNAGECTLRAAIQEANFANDSDAIQVPAGLYTLTIAGADEDFAATGDLDIFHSTTINGAGAVPHIHGNGNTTQDRVFEIHGGTVDIIQLKITGGRVNDAGGCIYNHADLNFESGEISDCHAEGNAGFGGAISSVTGSSLGLEFATITGNSAEEGGGALSINGDADIYKCTFSGNTASNSGGIRIANTADLQMWRSTLSENQPSALLNLGNADIESSSFFNNSSTSSAGAIANLGNLSMRNCTISGNSSDTSGGGLDNLDGATATLNNVTVAANSGSFGGGINASGTVNIQNTLIAQNILIPSGQSSDCVGTLSSDGNNLVGSLNGCAVVGDETGNIYNVDPLLAPLGEVGGPSPVHLLQSGSPAVDAGDDATCETQDQRQVSRPQFASCDIGSVEARSEFIMELQPDTIITGTGEDALITIALVSYFGYSSDVTLNCFGLPPGATCTFNPNPATPPADGTAFSTLTIDPANTPEGTYVISVVGVGALTFQSRALTLVISDSLFADNFEDNDASNWVFTKGNWDASGGRLIGTVDRKGDALSPDFGTCTDCTVEADIRIDSAAARVSLLGWYQDKKNLVEVRLMEDKNKVLLKQRSGGVTVAKQKALLPIDTGVNYNVRVIFDGYDFNVSINGLPLMTVSAGDGPNGNAGFRIKSVTGLPVSASFEQILVD